MSDQIVGNVQFGPSWEGFYKIDKAINDRVAKEMYEALKALVESSKLQSLRYNDIEAFNKGKDALVSYETSYNKN